MIASNTSSDVQARDRQAATSQQRQLPLVQPPVDVIDRGDELEVVADLPGCDDASVEITLDQGVLTIRGTPSEVQPANARALVREFRPVTYQRSFTVGDGVDIDQANATVRDGVLRLRVPKAASTRARRIVVGRG